MACKSKRNLNSQRRIAKLISENNQGIKFAVVSNGLYFEVMDLDLVLNQRIIEIYLNGEIAQ